MLAIRMVPLLVAERDYIATNFGADAHVVGIDEAGRGALAGPLTVAAVHVTASARTLSSVRDSKKMTKKSRATAFASLNADDGVVNHVVTMNATDIDAMNVRNATLTAMARCIEAMFYCLSGNDADAADAADADADAADADAADANAADADDANAASAAKIVFLVDGDASPEEYLVDENVKDNVNIITVVEGDDKYYSIACASVIAKVTRDELMLAQHQSHPAYGFDSHVGYGTAKHVAAIREHGPIPLLHRYSFKPVAAAASSRGA